MVAPLAGLAGATLLGRAGAWFATSKTGQQFSQVLYNPFVQSGQFGIGYTGGAYLGYGASNTWDPLRLHQTYKHPQSRQFKMPYGSYGRRRYNRYAGRTRYSGYTRYRRYRRYRRRSYYRRSYY